MVRVGVHCPVDKTLLSVVDWAKGIQSNTAQYFLQNPHTYQPRKVTKKEWDFFYRTLTTEGISPVFIHAPYVVNLCSSDDAVREKSIKVIQHLLQMIEKKPDSFLIVHIGYHGGSGFDTGFLRFRESLNSIQEVVAIHKLTIENSAGQTNAMGGSLEEIACLLDAFPSLGVCIDTAHIWGFGMTPKDSMLHRVLSGWQDQQRLKVIHLNNSKDEPGSKKDHHAKLNQGRIPEDDLKFFAKAFQQIPFILETPKNSLEEDKEQIRIFQQWFS